VCPHRIAAVLGCAGILLFLPIHATAQTSAQTPNELDAFMEKVLARREVNRRTLDEYVLDETEGFEILGPGRTPLHRSRREYTWYVRDGMHVRSPVRVSGVPVGDEARERYEAEWIRRERERRERKAKNQKEKEEEEGKTNVHVGSDGVQVTGATIPTEPRFVSEAYFLEFKFEPGGYYLAGREQIDGRPVLRIEYYPTRLFRDEDGERENRRRERRGRTGGQREAEEREREEDINRKMNKTALVTLWVDPDEHQIVKYTFDNVWLDFLPGAWLVRMDEIRASMTMSQPFPGVWLPRELTIGGGVTLANGSFAVGYERTFAEYRLAEVKTRIGPPRDRPAPPEAPAAPRPPERQPLEHDASTGLSGDAEEPNPRRGPFVPDPFHQDGQEVISEIRIHGNAFLTDQEVLAIAGVAVGGTIAPGEVEEIARRLKESRRFDSVDVRKRYRSLTSTTDVALVLVVHERPGVRSSTSPGGGGLPGVMGSVRSRVMFLPILGFTDGYGFTYGGRASTVDLLGAGERLSVPLTWGGTRRAALEFERLFTTGPVTRVESSVAIWNRENPRFGIRDQRLELKGRAERVFADALRAGVEASRSTVSFGPFDDRLWTLGTTLALDTRLDPAYPANAVLLGAGWTAMHFSSSHPVPSRVHRYSADARGYLRVYRQIVVAGRAQYVGADAGLPPYERLLLGGASSLRGFRTGTFDGDRLLTTTAELRVPVTSVLSGARLGVTAFLDAGKAWNYGASMRTAGWERGAGGGIFLIASLIKLNVDIARGFDTGSTRVHLSSGFTF